MNFPYIMRSTSRQIDGLKDLISFIKLKDIVMAEIGCYAGESTAIFCSSNKIKTVYCIDPWLNGYDDTDIASYHTDMNIIESIFDERVKPFKEKIIKRKMISSDASKKFKTNSLDFVYVDGNHQPEAIIEDLTNYIPLVKRGGYIGGHDWKHKKIIDPILSVMSRTPDKIFSDTSWIYKI